MTTTSMGSGSYEHRPRMGAWHTAGSLPSSWRGWREEGRRNRWTGRKGGCRSQQVCGEGEGGRKGREGGREREGRDEGPLN